MVSLSHLVACRHKNYMSQITVILSIFLLNEVTAVSQFSTVNQGTYRPRVFRRRYRRSALFPNTYTPAPTPPSKLCPCSSQPCQHLGDCKNTREVDDGANELGFQCTCVEHWTGERCNICNSDKKRVICENSCYGFNRDNECNDGGHGHVTSNCAIGTDCSDCSARCVRIGPEITTIEATTMGETTQGPLCSAPPHSMRKREVGLQVGGIIQDFAVGQNNRNITYGKGAQINGFYTGDLPEIVQPLQMSGVLTGVTNVEPVWLISALGTSIYKSTYDFSTFEFFFAHSSQSQVTYDPRKGLTIFGVSESSSVHHLYRRWDSTGASERFFTFPDPGAYSGPFYYIGITAVDPDTRLCYAGLNDIYEVNVDTGAYTLLYSDEKEIRHIARGFGSDLVWIKFTPPADILAVGNIDGTYGPVSMYGTGAYLYSLAVDRTDGLIYFMQGGAYNPPGCHDLKRVQFDGLGLTNIGNHPTSNYALGSDVKSGYFYLGTINGEIQRVDITLPMGWMESLETVLDTGTTEYFWHIHYSIPNVQGHSCHSETYQLIPVTFDWDTMEWWSGDTPATAVQIGTFTSSDIGTTVTMTDRPTYSMEFDSITDTPILHIDPMNFDDAGYNSIHYMLGGAVASEPSEFYILVTGVMEYDPILELAYGVGGTYDPVTDIATIMEGEYYTFSCLVTDADEAPTVNFTLPQLLSGDLIESYPSTEETTNCVAEPICIGMYFTAVAAEHDGQILECKATNSGWPTGRSDTMILNVISSN